MSHWRRLGGAMALLGLALVIGTIGYVVLGFTVLDAMYQTVTTISTVGFREVNPLSGAGKVFTMVLILLGVGAAFYAFGALIETFIEGRINELLGRRRMDKSIEKLENHVVICGWGRVGQSIAGEIVEAGRSLVVIESNPEQLDNIPHLVVVGDATDDDVLRTAGVERAAALVAAVDTDADNSFIALSARAMHPGLFIVARAREQENESKLVRAGADRVVNPQNIGGIRMAAFVLHPHVAEFVDVVMHERNLEFCLEEVVVGADSPMVGCTLRDSHLRDQTGALVLALRDADGAFITNPSPETTITEGHVIIAIGVRDQLASLARLVKG